MLFLAQSKYEMLMATRVADIEMPRTIAASTALSEEFLEIANDEKSKWQAYYYASLVTVQKGIELFRANELDKLDEVADAAQIMLDKANNLSANNAEIYILQKIILNLRIMVNPVERYLEFGEESEQNLNKARKIDPENPRITLLEAQEIYFMPQEYGGSKEEGLKLFEKAINQINTYPKKSEFYPSWGKVDAEYFLNNKP